MLVTRWIYMLSSWNIINFYDIPFCVCMVDNMGKQGIFLLLTRYPHYFGHRIGTAH